MTQIDSYSRSLDVHSTGPSTEYTIRIMQIDGVSSEYSKLADPYMDGVIYGPQALTEAACRDSCPIAKGTIRGAICSLLSRVEGHPSFPAKQYEAVAQAQNFASVRVVLKPNGTTEGFPNMFAQLALQDHLPCQKGGVIFPSQVSKEQAAFETPTVK